MGEREAVFVVDDAEINMLIVESILHDSYDIYRANSGQAMFELLHKITPSLIILDIEMPNMNGYYIIDKLKSRPKTRDIPVIFLTASQSSEAETIALQKGAVDFLNKPIKSEVLRARVDTHIQIQRQKAELLRLTRKSQEAVLSKSAFLSVMSHEMRTPLNAIIGLSELSLETENLSGPLYSNLVSIRNSGTTLLGIVNDILDISKIASGKLKLFPARYETESLLNDVISQTILQKGSKPIKFILTIDENFPAALCGDELRVKQILNNLLSNAFKYTSKGTVELAVKSATKGTNVWVSATVIDTGIGIRPEDLSLVFEDYMQTEATASRKMGGTGLGLPISKRMAKLMGGDITVESEPGKGSTFTARIRQEFVHDQPISPEVIRQLETFRYSEQVRLETCDLAKLDLRHIRVLVVDDTPTSTEVAAGLLRGRYGIKTDCVDNGFDAIDAMRDEKVRYDAILMDHMIPVMDGVEATKKIREIGTDYAKNIPIIAFTANATVGMEEKFLSQGFQGFLSKPIGMLDLDAIVRKFLCTDCDEYLGCPLDFVPADSPPILGLRVEGIDFVKGLARFAGDAGTYFDVLRTFAHNVPMALETAEKALGRDIGEYIVAVHGIKGSCFSICADVAGALAEALENAAKEGDTDFLERETPVFLENVRALVAELSAELAQSEDEKEEKNGPDPLLLKKLLDACERHDMNDIDSIAAELSRYKYRKFDNFVKWLCHMVDELNYAEIAELLKRGGIKSTEEVNTGNCSGCPHRETCTAPCVPKT